MAVLNKLFAETSTTRHIAAVTVPALLILGIFVVFEAFAVPMFGARLNQGQVVETSPEGKPQTLCIDRVLGKISVPQIDIGTYEHIWNLCGFEVSNELYLRDFEIRREKFTRQELDERITLALVVGITVSGIAMAALQLLMSYRLAQSGHGELTKDIELSVHKDKIALKSSVVGLAILVISLAFFVVYVKWIYTIEEVPVSSPVRQTFGREIPVNGALVPIQGKTEQRSSPIPPASP